VVSANFIKKIVILSSAKDLLFARAATEPGFSTALDDETVKLRSR
jgi:hypothetical protein